MPTIIPALVSGRRGPLAGGGTVSRAISMAQAPLPTVAPAYQPSGHDSLCPPSGVIRLEPSVMAGLKTKAA